jgi:hypothetical protein
MPARPLPNNPSLEHLRKHAKRLRDAVRGGEVDALAQVTEFHTRPNDAIGRFSLADAQLVTARSYGFASWARLKQHLTEIEPLVWNPPPLPDRESRVDVFLHWEPLLYACYSRLAPTDADHSTLEVARLLLSRGADPAHGGRTTTELTDASEDVDRPT